MITAPTKPRMSAHREAALDVLKELVRVMEGHPVETLTAAETAAARLVYVTLNDAHAIAGAQAALHGAVAFFTIGNRTYTIRTVDDLRTYLEREVPEPGR